MSACTAIIPAAGIGKRMNSSIKKQYININNKPILAYTLEKFQNCSLIDEIIIVTNADEFDYCNNEIIKKYSIDKVSKMIEGGKERQESVYKGLRSIDNNPSLVVIHDGVRPFISIKEIETVITEAQKCKAAAIGVPVKDTIKEVDENNFITNTPDRDKLWAIHTPQVFDYNSILYAHEMACREKYIGTDDTVLIEKYTDIKAKLILGSYFNIKITTQEDLILGEGILNNKI